MLSRKYRIPTEMFPMVTRGKTAQNDLFRVVFKYDNRLKNPKYAVIVSNKIAKTAVVRNLLRRQIYKILNACINDTPLAYVSIYPKKTGENYDELEKSIKSLVCSKK